MRDTGMVTTNSSSQKETLFSSDCKVHFEVIIQKVLKNS